MWAICKHLENADCIQLCCGSPAVAFKIYDLKDTGVIEQDEVKRLLAALLQENPAIDLNDEEIDDIVNQVSLCPSHSHYPSGIILVSLMLS